MADDARRFHIQTCLGSGGFGEVYLARMVSPGGVETQVAVKVLHEGLDPRSQAVQRLRDEARLLGSLNHPAVLKVRDLVMLESRVALVMEYVPGLDLEGCFDSRPPISMRAGLEVCARVADALRSAYETPGPDGNALRLVHRDIKPSNIRIGRHGDVKLLDFGIAKASDARREAKTQTRVTIGSPWYMAPERFDRVNDDPASDVYALGCTLYEVASGGIRLFEELSARDHFLLSVDPGRHDAHLATHFDPLGLETEVRATLESLLAYERVERPSTHDLGARLEDVAEGLSGLSLRKWVREVDWTEPPPAEGALVGRVLTEHRISHILTPNTPEPAAPRRGAALEGRDLTGRVPTDEGPRDTNATIPPDLYEDDEDELPPAGTPAPTMRLDDLSAEPVEPVEPAQPRRSPPVLPPTPPPPPKRRSGGVGNPIGWTVGFLGIAVVAITVGVGLLLLYFFVMLAVVAGIEEPDTASLDFDPVFDER